MDVATHEITEAQTDSFLIVGLDVPGRAAYLPSARQAAAKAAALRPTRSALSPGR